MNIGTQEEDKEELSVDYDEIEVGPPTIQQL